MKIRKTICILLLVILSITSLATNTFALELNQDINIQVIKECERNLYYRMDNGTNLLVATEIVGYYENGTMYPAYCLNNDRSRSRGNNIR